MTPDDKEEIEEISEDFNKAKLMDAMKQLEAELNQMGIYVDDLDDEKNGKVLDTLEDIFKIASEEGTRGTVYHANVVMGCL